MSFSLIVGAQEVAKSDESDVAESVDIAQFGNLGRTDKGGHQSKI